MGPILVLPAACMRNLGTGQCGPTGYEVMQVICSSRKPVPTPRKRGGALRYAWLRAPPLTTAHAQTRPKKGALDKQPHMRGGFPTRPRWASSAVQMLSGLSLDAQGMTASSLTARHLLDRNQQATTFLHEERAGLKPAPTTISKRDLFRRRCLGVIHLGPGS
jgi:hypothetical protein